MMSCNGYFCYVLRNILENKKYHGIGEALDKWNEYVQSFGFGHKLGTDFPKYYERQYTMVDTTNFKKVTQGMWRAVNSGFGSGGTASIAAVPGLDICGKTGTAQNPRGADNSVFICFAPKDDPKIAVAAYIENAGFGATWAAPIASLLVEKYLNGEISDQRRGLEDRVLQGNLMSKVKAYK